MTSTSSVDVHEYRQAFPAHAEVHGADDLGLGDRADRGAENRAGVARGGALGVVEHLAHADEGRQLELGRHAGGLRLVDLEALLDVEGGHAAVDVAAVAVGAQAVLAAELGLHPEGGRRAEQLLVFALDREDLVLVGRPGTEPASVEAVAAVVELALEAPDRVLR